LARYSNRLKSQRPLWAAVRNALQLARRSAISCNRRSTNCRRPYAPYSYCARSRA
jgi:hypothetical protein